MNEATQITMPYTIAVYMVRNFLGPDASQAHISRLTGILVRQYCSAHRLAATNCAPLKLGHTYFFVLQAACFCAAQFMTSVPLGYLSDTYGRKVSSTTSLPS